VVDEFYFGSSSNILGAIFEVTWIHSTQIWHCKLLKKKDLALQEFHPTHM